MTEERRYSREDIQPLLDALWHIALLERPDTEALPALQARDEARAALQKFGVISPPETSE